MVMKSGRLSNQWLAQLGYLKAKKLRLTAMKKKWEVSLATKAQANRPKIHPWTSPSGRFRKATLKDNATGEEREFLIYFGPWSERKRAPYVAILDQKRPILEVPINTASVFLAHSFSFRGIKDLAHKLHKKAIISAKHSGLSIQDDKVVLSERPTNQPLNTRYARSLLRNIIAAAYTKEFAKPDSAFRKWVHQDLRKFKMKTLRGGGKGKKSIELDLEKRYGSFRKHEKLIQLLRGKLVGSGYEISKYKFPNADVDLPAEKHKTLYIFEAKAWDKEHSVKAARHAYGQLRWYMWHVSHLKKRRIIGCVAFDTPPHKDAIQFLERGNDMCVVWRSGDSLKGGPKTQKLLRDIF